MAVLKTNAVFPFKKPFQYCFFLKKKPFQYCFFLKKSLFNIVFFVSLQMKTINCIDYGKSF